MRNEKLEMFKCSIAAGHFSFVISHFSFKKRRMCHAFMTHPPLRYISNID